jgi:hypothetical protein
LKPRVKNYRSIHIHILHHSGYQWVIIEWNIVDPPIVLEVIVVETQKQHVGIGVIQSLGACIITIGMEMVVVPK